MTTAGATISCPSSCIHSGLQQVFMPHLKEPSVPSITGSAGCIHGLTIKKARVFVSCQPKEIQLTLGEINLVIVVLKRVHQLGVKLALVLWRAEILGSLGPTDLLGWFEDPSKCRAVVLKVDIPDVCYTSRLVSSKSSRKGANASHDSWPIGEQFIDAPIA